MNNHQFSRFAGIITESYMRSVFILACCSMGSMALHAQKPAVEHYGVQVAVDWHTVAEPGYGASYRYSWEDIHAYSGEGTPVPMKMDLEMINDEGGGLFVLLSQPVMIPGSGIHITFRRHVVMRPSDAERGTSLPNDPQDKCRNHANGISRAIFHHRIAVVDAESGEILTPCVDKRRFDISRYQMLNDIDDKGEVAIDLDAFANRQIRLKTIVLVGYNGRGPARSTAPVISPISSITRQDLR